MAGDPKQRFDTAAERRQLTILFCDLVGSTALSSMMDIEDLHALLRAYQRACASCIEGAGGYVAHYAGDGVLAYFGYPAAAEDAPQRAIHAALQLRLIAERLPKPDGRELAVRTGVATGVVVVGDLIGHGPAQERAVAGETVNLAARLQTSAAPNTIVVAETTKRLADGVFEFRSLGPISHKGLPAPKTAWQVVGPRRVVSRFDGRRDEGVSRLVGRETELDQILAAWTLARSGRTRTVGLVGDAGFGKSRLLEEARRRICEEASAAWLEGGGVSLYANTPFHVAAQFAPPFAPEQLAANAAPTIGADSQIEMKAMFRRWVGDVAGRGPTVLVVEDLHWVDPSTLDLLDQVAMAAEDLPVLFIYTSRQDVTHRWPAGARHDVIALAGLDGCASEALARSAAGDLDRDQIRAVVDKAAGVPLYVEELARLVANRREALLASTDFPSRCRTFDPSLPLPNGVETSTRLDSGWRARVTDRVAIFKLLRY